MHQTRVRPLTSHGQAPAAEKKQLLNRRPKTALQLHREVTSISKLTPNEKPNERIRRTRKSPEKAFSNVLPKRDRSTSLSSARSTEVSPTQRSGKSRARSRTMSTSPLDVRQNRPTTSSFVNVNSSSNNKDIPRRVAWQEDGHNLDLRTLEISDCNDEALDLKPKNEGGSNDKKEEDSQDTEEPEKDLFEPPDLTVMESGDEYETELEDDSPAVTKHYDSSGRRAYLRLCKKEDVLPVSGLTNQFSEKEMIIRHRGLGWKGTLPLAKSLAKNIYVEKLDLADNYIEGVGASFVADMLVDNCYITELDLSQNFVGAEGGISLSKMLTKNQVLRKVVLRANHFTDRVAKSFAETLRENRTLRHLDLSHNEIGEHGAVYLGAGLALNYGLKHLDLSWNCIRGKGGVAVAQALKTNDSLTTLNLSWNGISLLGCVALGRFLRRNENLKELDLRNNRIGYLGAQRICPGISRNSSLEVLKVGLNPVADDGVEALLKAVKNNKSLKLLGLEDVTVSPAVHREIQQLEQDRQIRIITGGLGGYKKPKEMPRQMAILLDFVKVNRLRLIDWFFQFDKDHSGDISKDEFKNGLKEIGLKMTQKQLDTLIEYLDVDNNGKIEYSELLTGRDHTLREQRDFRMAQQKLRNMEDMRARLPTIQGFEPD